MIKNPVTGKSAEASETTCNLTLLPMNEQILMLGGGVDSSFEPWTTHIHLFVRTVLSLDADEPRQTVRFCLNVNDTVA